MSGWILQILANPPYENKAEHEEKWRGYPTPPTTYSAETQHSQGFLDPRTADYGPCDLLLTEHL